MNKEITMESVFFAGFMSGAAFGEQQCLSRDDYDNHHTDVFWKRNQCWLDYVKELENGKQ